MGNPKTKTTTKQGFWSVMIINDFDFVFSATSRSGNFVLIPRLQR